MTGTVTRADLRTAREELRNVRETRQVPVSGFELREVLNGVGGTSLRFSGYASVTCADHDDESHAYEMEDMLGPWLESIVRGAFTKTIEQGCDTTFLVNHTGVSMARSKPGTLKLIEDTTGLHVDATLNPSRPDVQILRAAVEDGAIDEMSFAFRVLRNAWGDDYTRRWITEISLDRGDVSPCNFGANPHTGGLVAIRNRVFGGPSERPADGRRASVPDEGPVVLPDFTTGAKLALARARGAR